MEPVTLATQWYKDGFDYPNWTTTLTADYTATNNLLLSLRAGWHRQDQNNQQVGPPPNTYFYFDVGNINAGYDDDPYYIANPTLLHYTGWANYTTWQERLRTIYDKVSTNLDVTYYANLAGEHAIKGGFQWIYLHEDVYNGAPYPHVNLNSAVLILVSVSRLVLVLIPPAPITVNMAITPSEAPSLHLRLGLEYPQQQLGHLSSGFLDDQQ